MTMKDVAFMFHRFALILMSTDLSLGRRTTVTRTLLQGANPHLLGLTRL